MADVGDLDFNIVVRKSCFGLPTACSSCLPVYLYLKFSRLRFNLRFNNTSPDSDKIPYVENGVYVAYNNENGGIIERLKEDGIIDLDSGLASVPEWLSTKAMISSWLLDALQYELWVESSVDYVYEIYYSSLPWPIGKILLLKQGRDIKKLLGITDDDSAKKKEIYNKVDLAYGALATLLGEQSYFFENRPTSLDALFLAHALIVTHVLPESSELRCKLAEHGNLLRYAESLKKEFTEVDFHDSSTLQNQNIFSRIPKRGFGGGKKAQEKREKTEEEKQFGRRSKYFLIAQIGAVLTFLSMLRLPYDEIVLEVEDDDDDNP